MAWRIACRVIGTASTARHCLYEMAWCGIYGVMLLSTTLRLFLDSLGRREEYEYYLRKFQSAPGTCFAAIAPDELSIQESLEAIEFDLRFLLRLELLPLLVLTGGSALPAVATLRSNFPSLETIPVGASDQWIEAVGALIREVRPPLPLLVLLAPDRTPQELLERLIPQLVRRVQWLRAQGPLRDTTGRRVAVHLLQGLNDHELDPADREDPVLKFAESVLQRVPAVHISVASPLDLLAELFTVRGKGTVIRRGSTIRRVSSVAFLDLDRLRSLLDEAFGRPLVRTESLFQATDIYIEENYRGAALLEAHPAGTYLSKFAVGTQARGEGLAQELWSHVRRDHPTLFWRSRPDNPINGWYDQQADGRLRDVRWHIFWRGIRTADIPAIVEYCRQRPEDFAPAPPPPTL